MAEIDREKVIKELQRMADVINQYDDMLSVDNVDSWVILDALVLLKDQEPVKPIEIRNGYECGKCQRYLCLLGKESGVKYCNYCGKAVNWE